MSISVERVREIGEELNKHLRLRTYPVGINLYSKAADVPEGFEEIDDEFAFCHFVGMARYHEKPIYSTGKCAKSCAVGGRALGFGELAENFAEVNVGRFAPTVEAINKATSRLKPFRLGEFEAFSIAPLNKVPIVPDVIQVFCNPIQLIELVYSNTWEGEPEIEMKTNGHGASCYEALVIPYREQQIRIAIADMGDRRYGYASDDEMIMGIPVGKLEMLYDGLINTLTTINRYPLLYNFYPVPKHVKDKIAGK